MHAELTIPTYIPKQDGKQDAGSEEEGAQRNMGLRDSLRVVTLWSAYLNS